MVSSRPQQIKDTVTPLIKFITHELRDKLKESYYKTSKESGLRPDVIKKIESLHVKASADSVIRYIGSYNARFPMSAYCAWYNAGQLIRNQNLFKD